MLAVGLKAFSLPSRQFPILGTFGEDREAVRSWRVGEKSWKGEGRVCGSRGGGVGYGRGIEKETSAYFASESFVGAERTESSSDII